MKIARFLAVFPLLLSGCSSAPSSSRADGLEAAGPLAGWTQSEDRHVLSIDAGEEGLLELTVVPGAGGRISSLRLGGAEVLFPGTGLLQGSTFWTSPQSDWGWPPSGALDSEPYDVALDEDQQTLRMRSQRFDPITGFALGKRIAYDPHRRAIRIDYVLTNEGQTPKRVAPWEITRVPLGGIAFFPQESDYTGRSKLSATLEENGLSWLRSGPDTSDKLFRDGAEAWIAHAREGLLFVKRYQGNSAREEFANAGQDDAEAEIEIYANPRDGYIEIEEQGAYQELRPREERVWTVHWHVARIPDQTKIEVGAQGLVVQARDLVNASSITSGG